MSSRTRFPTIFERFSTRFGTALPNPDLNPERAINYELGWEVSPLDNASFSAAVFYNDVKDMIETIVVSAGPPQLTQTQNVGDGEFYGVELGTDLEFTSQLRVGANYTYLKRRIIDPLQPNFKPTGTPSHQGFIFASYRPVDALAITPSVELADDRWSDVTDGSYVKVGAYTLLGLQAQYRYNESCEVALGGRNLLDKNYQLADGFPDAGRSFYGKFRVSF